MLAGVTYSNKEKHSLKRVIKWKDLLNSFPCGVGMSLNKSIKPPSNPEGLLSEGSPSVRDTDRLGGYKGLSFPGVLTEKCSEWSKGKGNGNLPFSHYMVL